MNAQLKKEAEKLSKRMLVREDYSDKFRDLKVDYRQLIESYEKSESIRRDQKEIISEMKK